nr:helix-turn-helix transcriptional regulator [Bordetella genomosp. 13]
MSAVAAAIGDPARARMLCSLLDGCARTATELAALADIGASTASAHFTRLREQGLVEIAVQGKHRYYRLATPQVAAALEALLVVAGVPHSPFKPSTPQHLHHARTCYDHMAGTLAVRMHDAMLAQGWLRAAGEDYELTPAGSAALQKLGLQPDALRRQRRRFAYPCLDWSSRRPHLAGGLAAALLAHCSDRGWVARDMDSRALRFSAKGERQFAAAFGLAAEPGQGD